MNEGGRSGLLLGEGRRPEDLPFIVAQRPEVPYLADYPRANARVTHAHGDVSYYLLLRVSSLAGPVERPEARHLRQVLPQASVAAPNRRVNAVHDKVGVAHH